LCFREDTRMVAVSLTKPDIDSFVVRQTSLTFMGSLGNCGVLKLQTTQPPLRGEKRFTLMKTGYVNTCLC